MEQQLEQQTELPVAETAAATENTTAAVINEPVTDLQLTATIPNEMVVAQQDLINWCDKKIASVQKSANELKEAVEHAMKMHWKRTTLQTHYNKEIKRVQFYEKIKEALVAGYYIVPNFPVQMFAIRTEKTYPKGVSYNYWSTHVQNAQELPVDAGEYKNPFPVVYRERSKDNAGNNNEYSYAHGWDEFEFPITMSKPAIMGATTRAMALKIFDEIGIIPKEKNDDPMIIGRITYRNKAVSFLIAWHLDTRVL